VATGLYTYNDTPFYFHYMGGREVGGPEIMTDMFVRDIEQASPTRHQSGHPQVRHDAPASPGVERCCARCPGAQTHRSAISTHTTPGCGAAGTATHLRRRGST